MTTCAGGRPPPAPDELLRREVKEGREAIAQRALSSLMLGHEPLKWNVPDEVTPSGARFLRTLDHLAFSSPSTPEVLVDGSSCQARTRPRQPGGPTTPW